MSQRLSDSAVLDLEARGLGRFTTPLGYRSNGSPFYLIGGASPDDGSNGGEGGTGGSGEGGSGTGSEGQQGGEGGTGEGAGGNKDGKESETVSKADLDAALERMKAADRRAAAAEAKAKELEEKDLSEQEKVLKRVPELEQKVTQLSEENTQLKAKVAFLATNEHTWHDPEVALGQVDLTEVLKEDGDIDKKALKSAVDKLAKDKPFLVKSSNDGNGAGGNGSGSGSGGGQGSSGSPVGGGKPGQKQGLDEAALRKKYPALN